MTDDLMEVTPSGAINSILGLMENKTVVAQTRQYVTDESITTRKELKEALKQGRVPGNAIIQWSDEQGPLRVNIIEFLCEQKVKAIDPKTGQAVIVPPTNIPDRSWRVLY